MMPIFFHSEAHLWIAYALFFNGFLLNRLLIHASAQYRHFARGLEVQVLLSFAFSLSINGLILLGLDIAGLKFAIAKPILMALSASCLAIVVWRKLFLSWSVEVNWWGIPLYAAMFIILFYNGGLIDQVSDAWWHMSLANKIGWASSFTLEYGHLTGAPDRYYPPLWHANLALLRELSDQSLPIIWNAFTAWGGVLKLMGYYLVGLALFKDRKVAMLGALFFALLPGFGNSYMRVSAWPSHISYIFWFFSIYVAFAIIDKTPALNSMSSHLKELFRNYVLVLVLCLLLVLIFFLHQFELLLFLAAFCLYFCGLSLSKFSATENLSLPKEANLALYTNVYRLGMLALLIASAWLAYKLRFKVNGLDYAIVLGLPMLLFATLLAVDFSARRFRTLSIIAISVLLGVILLSLSYQHLASLFVPEMALPKGPSHERPLVATGWFGGTLGLPGWHLQLRTGLLWSGVIGALVSFAAVMIKPSRGWVFIAANTLFIWLLILSPYLYQWFTDGLKYHSVWRFGMMSFHPLAVSALMLTCLMKLRSSLVIFGNNKDV